MRKLGDKKGDTSTLTLVIAIALGILVLVFLVFGFSSGWGNLWDKITNFGGGKANVDTIKQACELACSTSNSNDFCTQKRTANFDEGFSFAGTCKQMSAETVKAKKGTEEKELSVGVSACPSLC